MIAVGERVRIRGLRQEPWHNGTLGLVVGLVQTPSGPRLNVACHAKSGSSVGLCLKVANLERVPEEDDVAAPEAELLQERDKLSDVGTSVSALPVSTI